MLKITNSNIIKDSERFFKSDESFGQQIGYNNKPLQFYDAFGDGSNIIFFYAHKLKYQNVVELTFELSLDTILYDDGQYFADPTKYFDNVDNTNVLPNGVYYLSFGNENEEIFYSEIFQAAQEYIDGSDSFVAPKVKHFENDVIVIFND